MPGTTKKAIILGLDDKQKKMLRVLLKYQKDICRLKENRRRGEYYK